MDALAVIISSIVFYVTFIEAVPPQACFANFRWDDCGHPPVPVMYYWKPGSRCEVGIWRGCRPNLNMFKSEYECVSTCIFTITPRPIDWHIKDREEVYDYDDLETTTDVETTTIEGESGSGDGSGSGSGEEGSGGSGADGSGSGDGGASGAAAPGDGAETSPPPDE